MYLSSRNWLEQGPRQSAAAVSRRGLGDAPAAADETVVVTGCAPDICLNLGFPWVGRRTELAPGQAQPFGSFERDGSGCRCKTVLDLPTAVGIGITGFLGVLMIAKVVGGRG